VAVLRTALVAIPPVIGDILLTLLADHFTVDVVARLDTAAGIEQKLPLVSPDLVIVGLLGGEDDTIGRTLLALVPLAKVIVLSSDGRNAYVHEMRAHRSTLMDVSPPRLIEAIMGAAND
jgi:DNA-binding NarL/FixJ family response regulator